MPPPSTTDGSNKINMDLFSLTYGSVISQLIVDCDNNCDEINKQLDSMGYNIGVRLIEDFLAKSSNTRCRNSQDIAEKIQLAFQLYLSVTPKIDNWSEKNNEFSVILNQNPLTEFVELPDTMQNMSYLNILPGVIRGALEMVSVSSNVYITRDQLRGDDDTEIRVELRVNTNT